MEILLKNSKINTLEPINPITDSKEPSIPTTDPTKPTNQVPDPLNINPKSDPWSFTHSISDQPSNTY